MTGWDISVSGVSFVTSLTSDAIDGLNKDVKSYSTHMEAAGTHAGVLNFGTTVDEAGSGAVTSALGLFFEETFSDVAFLSRRASKSVNGAIDATIKYDEGAIQMAADVQEKAVRAPAKVDMPKGDQGGGHK